MQIQPRTVFRSESFDPDNPGNEPLRGIIRHEWTFETPSGDAMTLTGPEVGFGWEKEGRYQVTLTVTDDEGMIDSKIVYIKIRGPSPIVNRFVWQPLDLGPYAIGVIYLVSSSDNNVDRLKDFVEIWELVVSREDQGLCGSDAVEVLPPWFNRCLRREKRTKMWPAPADEWDTIPLPLGYTRGFYGDQHGPWHDTYLDIENLRFGVHTQDQTYRFWAPWLRVGRDDLYAWPLVGGDAIHVIERRVFPQGLGWVHRVKKGPDEREDVIR